MTELGHASADTPGWSGMVVKAGTPPAVVARLHESVLRVLQAPEIVQRDGDADGGATPSPLSVAQFTEFVASENRRWQGVIQKAGVALQ